MKEVNAGKADHDNLHDENARETPSNFTSNPNKGTSYANLFTVRLRKAMNVVVPVESIRAITERLNEMERDPCVATGANLNPWEFLP
ncbi:hypothetical protein Tco_1494232, partial [Tanacetum coccineum]